MPFPNFGLYLSYVFEENFNIKFQEYCPGAA